MTQAQIDGNIKAGKTRTKHGYGKRGQKSPRIYKIWQGMKERCYGINSKSYHKYGGIGITVCSEWKDSFESFLKWSMKNGYNKTMHLDKDELCELYQIEPKIYSPKTCQWIMQHKNNIIENQLHTNDKEMEIVELYVSGSTITELSKIYYIGIGISQSAPTKYIEELLRRYGVYKPRLNKSKISNETIVEILNSTESISNNLTKHKISKSKWYRAIKKYKQRNHTK